MGIENEGHVEFNNLSFPFGGGCPKLKGKHAYFLDV